MTEKLAYSIDEAAAALSISRSSMKTLLYTGQVDSVCSGRRRLVPRWALMKYLNGEGREDSNG